MAAAVEATYNCGLVVNETVALGLDDSDDVDIERDIGTHRGTLTATTTVKVTKSWADTGALVAGVATIDFTALSNGNLPDVDFTDLYVKVFKIVCPAANSADVVFAVGAGNPYDLFGSASDRVSVPPGGALVFYWADGAEKCDATHKTIDLSSGHATAAYSIALVAGGL